MENDFKVAYEKQVKEIEALKKSNQMWIQHAITLGKVIAEIIEEDPNGRAIHS